MDMGWRQHGHGVEAAWTWDSRDKKMQHAREDYIIWLERTVSIQFNNQQMKIQMIGQMPDARCKHLRLEH